MKRRQHSVGSEPGNVVIGTVTMATVGALALLVALAHASRIKI